MLSESLGFVGCVVTCRDSIVEYLEGWLWLTLIHAIPILRQGGRREEGNQRGNLGLNLHEGGHHGFKFGIGCSAAILYVLVYGSEFLLYLLLYLCGNFSLEVVGDSLF